MHRIEVHYSVELTDKDFRRVLKKAKKIGYEYSDFGKKEIIRRYLVWEGLDNVLSIVGKHVDRKGK